MIICDVSVQVVVNNDLSYLSARRGVCAVIATTGPKLDQILVNDISEVLCFSVGKATGMNDEPNYIILNRLLNCLLRS